MSDLTEWLGGIPEPGTSIFAASPVRKRTLECQNAFVFIGGRILACGTSKAMRAAARLLHGECEAKPSVDTVTPLHNDAEPGK